MDTRAIYYRTNTTRTFSFATWFDTYYIFCMIPIGAIVLYYNFYALEVSTFLEWDQAFAKLFLSNLDTTAVDYYPWTFPMWGYGFLIALTGTLTNTLPLLLIQLAVAFLSIYYFVSTIETYTLLTNGYVRLFKFLLVFSIPWYTFHVLAYPYSISSSLLILSISFLYRAVQENQYLPLIVSGIMFGVLLNLRSDYILLPIGLAAIIFLFNRSLNFFKKTALWFVCIYSCLIPWALFTHKACGHYLLTSTNGGNVMLLGLGKLKNNKWGISLDLAEGAPVIHTFIDDVYGKNACTWDYKGNEVLKEKFFELIWNDPYEYIKKIYASFFYMFKVGLHQGYFIKHDPFNSFFKENNKTIIKKVVSSNPPSVKNIIAIFLERFSYLIHEYLLIPSLIALPFSFLSALFYYQIFYALIFSATFYQIGLVILLDPKARYTSNVYIFFLIAIVYFFYAASAYIKTGKIRHTDG